MRSTLEHHESLWRLTVSPLAWAFHFMGSYITAAIWCEKIAPRTGDTTGLRYLVAVYTLVALCVIGWNAYDGWRRHSHGEAELPHDEDTPEDRHRFLGFATVLLAALSAIATVFAGFVIVLLEDCA